MLYTIGHGRRKEEVFLALLKQYDIRYLIDVRSVPYSRFNPQYNRKYLEKLLPQHGMRYVFMGDTLGGRPTDRDCYTPQGKVNYEAIKQKDFFQKGIQRVKTAYKKELSLALMCSESNPCQCHRSRLIGAALQEAGFHLLHIDENGKLKEHIQVMQEISGRKNLFNT